MARTLGKVAGSGLTKGTLGHTVGLSDAKFCLSNRYIAIRPPVGILPVMDAGDCTAGLDSANIKKAMIAAET
jgi:hypothetical protein